jgi:hypothetical protein
LSKVAAVFSTSSLQSLVGSCMSTYIFICKTFLNWQKSLTSKNHKCFGWILAVEYRETRARSFKFL